MSTLLSPEDARHLGWVRTHPPQSPWEQETARNLEALAGTVIHLQIGLFCLAALTLVSLAALACWISQMPIDPLAAVPAQLRR
jgi:hypothetical protein